MLISKLLPDKYKFIHKYTCLPKEPSSFLIWSMSRDTASMPTTQTLLYWDHQTPDSNGTT